MISNILISSITGVLASFFVWWLTFKCWVPKIRFAAAISKLPTDENPSCWKYRFKFENSGRRDIIDLEIVIRLRIKGLRPTFPDNWEVIYLSMSSLEYKKIAIVRPVQQSLLRPVFEIKVYACEYFNRSFFPEAIRKKADQQKLMLEDILSMGSEANLQVMILGYNAFSGARKFFQSPFLTISNIAQGGYEKHSLKLDSDNKGGGDEVLLQ